MKIEITMFDYLDVLFCLRKKYEEGLLSEDCDLKYKSQIYLGMVDGMIPTVISSLCETYSLINADDSIRVLKYQALINLYEKGVKVNLNHLTLEQIKSGLDDNDYEIFNLNKNLTEPMYSKNLKGIYKETVSTCFNNSLVFIRNRGLLKEEYLTGKAYTLLIDSAPDSLISKLDMFMDIWFEKNKLLTNISGVTDYYFLFFLESLESSYANLYMDRCLGSFSGDRVCLKSLIKFSVVFSKINEMFLRPDTYHEYITMFSISSMLIIKPSLGLEVSLTDLSEMEKIIKKTMHIKLAKEYLETLKEYPYYFLFGKREVSYEDELSRLLDKMSYDTSEKEKLIKAFNKEDEISLSKEEYGCLLFFLTEFIVYSSNQRSSFLSYLETDKSL